MIYALRNATGGLLACLVLTGCFSSLLSARRTRRRAQDKSEIDEGPVDEQQQEDGECLVRIRRSAVIPCLAGPVLLETRVCQRLMHDLPETLTQSSSNSNDAKKGANGFLLDYAPPFSFR